MRIVYVIKSLPFGRGEEFIIAELQHLMQIGHAVRIVPLWPRGPIVHAENELLTEHAVRAPLVSPGVLAAALAGALHAPRRVVRTFNWLFRSRRPANCVKSWFLYPKALWLARLARRWRADHIHAHWATAPATMAMTAGELASVPWSFTAHRYDVVADDMLAAKVARASFARFISQSGLQMAQELGVPPSAANVCVLHMGVPVAAGLPELLAGEAGLPETVYGRRSRPGVFGSDRAGRSGPAARRVGLFR